MRHALLHLVFACFAAAQVVAQAAGPYPYTNPNKVLKSSHDFSLSSPAAIRSQSATDVCVFCHTPHKAQPGVPLWNHSLGTGQSYTVYSSSTLQSSVSAPTASDSSKLCLSCHDGTVALGDTVNNGQIPFQGPITADQKVSPDRRSFIGLDLSDDHPVAFIPDTMLNTQIHVPPIGDPVHLDGGGKVQCTSCHNPHQEDIDVTERRFLVKVNNQSAICTACHDLKGGSGTELWSWSGTQGGASSHQSATNPYTVQTNDEVSWLGSHTGYTTTTANGCETCHRPHTANQAQRLLKGETDQVCFQCHDGNSVTGIANVKAEFGKAYIHPAYGPVPDHDPDEAPDQIATRHSACDDCHNAHAARSDPAPVAPPQMPGSLLGNSGFTASGTPHDPHRGTGEAAFEYEVCLKCHSYNLNKPQVPGYAKYGPLPNRQVPSTDLRLAFMSPASAHAVINPAGLTYGPAAEVPSLLPAPVDANGLPLPGRILSSSSLIFCTDCHNDDEGRQLGAGFTKPAGPHGSNNIHILERSYLVETPAGTPGQTPNIGYSSTNYAICYKCHSEQNLLSNASFANHSDHIQEASCATCHDAHGVPNGSPGANAALINFDLNIVAPNSQGVLSFTRQAPGQGTCNLMCHGQDHVNITYSRSAANTPGLARPIPRHR